MNDEEENLSPMYTRRDVSMGEVLDQYLHLRCSF
jgi:hypothetical protein